MQSVLVKIVPPAQTHAPCDQRTARVRTTVDLCLDLLAKVLRSATVRLCGLRFCERRIGSAMDSLHELLRAAPCRLRTCEDGKRRKIGASVEPAQKSAPCELRGARCDRRNRTACATVCELRAVLCELQSCLSTCLASMLRAAICELRLATGPQLADCGSRIAARRFACRATAQSIALGTMMRRATCDVQSATSLTVVCP